MTSPQSAAKVCLCDFPSWCSDAVSCQNISCCKLRLCQTTTIRQRITSAPFRSYGDLYVSFKQLYVKPPAYVRQVLCVDCGVGNKLRDSCKETRFYFHTQLRFVFCFVHLFKQQNTKPTHMSTCSSYNSYEFSLKGREGGLVQNFDKRLVPPTTSPTLSFVSLSLSLGFW